MHSDPPHKIIITPKGIGSKGHVYAVSFDGTEIITKTHNPELNACRWLIAHGYHGRMEVWDTVRPYPRMIIKDIERAAGLTISESDKQTPRFVKYRPMPDECKNKLAA